jgi:hypothetical protein
MAMLGRREGESYEELNPAGILTLSQEVDEAFLRALSQEVDERRRAQEEEELLSNSRTLPILQVESVLDSCDIDDDGEDEEEAAAPEATSLKRNREAVEEHASASAPSVEEEVEALPVEDGAKIEALTTAFHVVARGQASLAQVLAAFLKDAAARERRQVQLQDVRDQAQNKLHSKEVRRVVNKVGM